MTLFLIVLGASAQTDYSWALSAGTWYGNTGTYADGVEHYQDNSSGGACTAGKILYEIVSELPAGEYTLTFYAVANMAWNSYATGSDIAQVYVTANGETPDGGCYRVRPDRLHTERLPTHVHRDSG